MEQKVLYLFNPDHDLALTGGEPNYMAPASARRMAEELALLPTWYADPGSAVLASSAHNLAYLDRMRELLHLPVSLLTEPELAAEEPGEIRPWGWNTALRRRLAERGVCDEVLPSVELLGHIRTASHRSSAVDLLPHLQRDGHFCGESFYLTRPEEWQQFVESHERCVLKAPWSGSGKGLNWCRGAYTPVIAGWCTRIGSRQGGVIAEPIYNKVEDFAMEFRAIGNGRFCFAGYSLFHTGGSGAYEGNLLLSDEVIERRLSAYVPVESLHWLRSRLEEELSVRFGRFYSGYIGVDMMICRMERAPIHRIHPCVELNLRMNMGVTARRLYDRYLSPGSSGMFRIGYHREEGEAWRLHEELTETLPLEVGEGRVRSGYLSLVPVHRKSVYRAWIEVSPGE